MHTTPAKALRRRILLYLYECYRANPVEMLGPEVVLDALGVDKADLLFNMHYLHDHGLVEMLMGYQPPLFSAVRLTGRGVDVVESRFELNQRFPEAPGDGGDPLGDLPALLERLLEEAECAPPLDGDDRRTLLRDVHFLREEIARPVERWRPAVLRAALDWMAEGPGGPHLPALDAVRERLRGHVG